MCRPDGELYEKNDRQLLQISLNQATNVLAHNGPQHHDSGYAHDIRRYRSEPIGCRHARRPELRRYRKRCSFLCFCLVLRSFLYFRLVLRTRSLAILCSQSILHFIHNRRVQCRAWPSGDGQAADYSCQMISILSAGLIASVYPASRPFNRNNTVPFG